MKLAGLLMKASGVLNGQLLYRFERRKKTTVTIFSPRRKTNFRVKHYGCIFPFRFFREKL